MAFKLKKLAIVSSVILSALALQACNDKESTTTVTQQPSTAVVKAEKADMKSLDVSVIYLDRRMLPPGAVLTVTLEDVSLADAPSVKISSESMDVAGSPPYPVTLNYDAQKINAQHRYNVRATIKVDDKLVMTSTSALDPFAPNLALPLKVKLDRVMPQQPVKAENNNALMDQSWQLVTLAGKTVKPGDDGNVAFIEFDSATNNANGFSGCNNFQGSFDVKNDKLSMGPAASTRKMCKDGMELEGAFLATMPNFASYTITDGVLTIKDNQANTVATFKSK